MSHWNGYEIWDISGDEDSRVNNFLPFHDEQALESVISSDSHKKPRYEVANDVKTSIYREGPANVHSKDKRVLSSSLKEGSFSIPDLSWSLVTEKKAQALGLTKCSTGSTILDCQGAKISTSSFGDGENGTGNTTLCSDYPFPGKRGGAHHKEHGDNSLANASVLTKEQRDGENDLQFYDCPNIEDFEDFARMFRNLGSTFVQRSNVTGDELPWFSSGSHGFHGMEETLHSVVLSSVSESSAFDNASSSHGLCVNILPAREPSAINTETPSSTRCSSFPMYSDAERKGKSVLSEQAYFHAGIVEKNSALEHIGYGNERRDPDMINMTLKELYTTTGKKVNSTLGSTVQSSLSGFSLIQNVQDQDFHSSVASALQPGSLQVISKQNLFSECYAPTCLNSYIPQAQMSGIFKLQHVPPGPTTLKSSALPNYVTSNNPSSHAAQSIGILPGAFPMPSIPIEKNEKIYAYQKFAAPLIMDKSLGKNAATSDSSVQTKNKFEEDLEGVRKPVYTSGNLPAVNIGSPALQVNSYTTSNFLDDVSLKAANFQQLQMITDQLGDRTKLCIRDSLYRLAISAEQSHYYGTAINESSGSSPLIGLQGAKDLKRPPEILGVPISTNAIERSIAYLLFHKSLESDSVADNNNIWFKSPIHIHGPAGNCKEPDLPAS